MKTATIRDRIIHLGFDYPDKWRAWALGNIVRDAWVRKNGSLPDKVLRVKTSGLGSHCFAHYPESFWPTIDSIIRRVLDEPQGLLPFPTEDE